MLKRSTTPIIGAICAAFLASVLPAEASILSGSAIEAQSASASSPIRNVVHRAPAGDALPQVDTPDEPAPRLRPSLRSGGAETEHHLQTGVGSANFWGLNENTGQRGVGAQTTTLCSVHQEQIFPRIASTIARCTEYDFQTAQIGGREFCRRRPLPSAGRSLTWLCVPDCQPTVTRPPTGPVQLKLQLNLMGER